MAMEATMPMIATTIKSSIKEKPFAFRIMFVVLVVEKKERGEFFDSTPLFD